MAKPANKSAFGALRAKLTFDVVPGVNSKSVYKGAFHICSRIFLLPSATEMKIPYDG